MLSSEMSAITDLFAGVPVSDLDVSIDWYTRFFGRPPDMRVGDEILWDIEEHATLFIEPNAAQAGAGRITLAVTGLDVRHVKIPDPDGNAIAFAEPPETS
jgi:catechol 2,3-dioxygenase-like lactoylglutathione lyase family enzyme